MSNAAAQSNSTSCVTKVQLIYSTMPHMDTAVSQISNQLNAGDQNGHGAYQPNVEGHTSSPSCTATMHALQNNQKWIVCSISYNITPNLGKQS